MSVNADTDGASEWKTGLLFVVAVALGGGGTGLALRSTGVPFGLLIGAVVGGVITFLVVSYLYYGR